MTRSPDGGEIPTTAAPRARRRLLPRALAACLVAVGSVQLIIQLRGFLDGRHGRFVGQVAFSPDGARLAWTAEGDGGGSVVVWDLVRGRRWLEIGPRVVEADRVVASSYTTLAFSPDGRTIAAGARAVDDPDPRIILWSAATGRVEQILRGHADSVVALAYAPDGRTLASASRDRTVKLWDVASGRVRETLAAGDVAVTSVAFSPDGRSVATGWGDGRVRLWDAATGRPSEAFDGHAGGVTCLAYAPDGRTLASAGSDETLRLRDCRTGLEIVARGGLANPCRAIVFSPDGETLAIKFAETSTGALWDVAAWRERATFADAAGGLAFAPGGGTLAAGGGGEGKVFLIPLPPATAPVSTNRR